MTPEVLRREAGRSIHRYGGLAFGEMFVLTVSHDHLAGNSRVRSCRVVCGHVARLLVGAGLAHAAPVSPDEALARLLGEARASLPGACADPASDGLIRILCAGEIRVGVRNNYPLFATSEGGRAIRLRHRRRPRHRRPARRPARVGAGAGGHAHRRTGRGRGRPRHRHDGPQHAARRPGTIHPAALLPVRDHRGRSARDARPRPERSVGALDLRHRRQLRQCQSRLAGRASDAVRRREPAAARPPRRDLPPRRTGRQLLRFLPRRPRLRRALRAEVRLRSGPMGHGGTESGQRAPRRGSGADQPDHAPGRRLPRTRPPERCIHGFSRGAARAVAAAGLCRPGGEQRSGLRPAGARGRTATDELRPGGGTGARVAARPARHRPVPADADQRAGLETVPGGRAELARPRPRHLGRDARRGTRDRCCLGNVQFPLAGTRPGSWW